MEIELTCSSDHMPRTSRRHQTHLGEYEDEYNRMVLSTSIRGGYRRLQRRNWGASKRQAEERYQHRERLL